MICPNQPVPGAKPKHGVSEIIEEISGEEVTVELVETEENEARWNKLIVRESRLTPSTPAMGLPGLGQPAREAARLIPFHAAGPILG